MAAARRRRAAAAGEALPRGAHIASTLARIFNSFRRAWVAGESTMTGRLLPRSSAAAGPRCCLNKVIDDVLPVGASRQALA